MRKFWLLCLLAFAVLIFSGASIANAPVSIRIGLTSNFGNRDSIHINNTNITAGYDNNGVFQSHTQLHSASGFTAQMSGGVVALYSGNQQVFSFTDTTRGAQVMETGGGAINLGNYSYRGAIEFSPSGTRITAINVICPEEYLFGVLPMEMSHTFHIEALRAQAIASRTFMIHRINDGHHRNNGFDLCDSTHCQSYNGTGREHVNTTRAVNETAGLLIYHNNAPILAVYFASSGGSTANSEDVWVQPLPYLRAVRDIAEHNPVEWTRTFTWAQINTALANAGANIGTATGLTITRTCTYGRVNELTVQGTSGQHVLIRESIRTFFSPIGGSLMSRNFYIAGAAPATGVNVSVTDGSSVLSAAITSFLLRNTQGATSPVSTGVYVFDGVTMRRVEAATQNQVTTLTTGVTLHGQGWGHGVGMSQRGAHGMALAGYTYRQILLHYYTGVEIR